MYNVKVDENETGDGGGLQFTVYSLQFTVVTGFTVSKFDVQRESG